MNRTRLWPAVLLALAAFAAPTPARAAYLQPGPGGGSAPQAPKPSPSADQQEQVEILRRLLDGAFAEAYGFPAHKPVTPLIRFYPLIGAAQLYDTNQPSAVHADYAAPQAEGVYLKDYGVVYTTTLPAPGFDPMPGSKPGKGDKTPLDDWERARKQLHGETPEPEGKAVPAHKPLSEVILKVLAENGRHFTSLADGERITVAVTFRGAANCANCHQNPWNPGQPDQPLTTFQAAPGGPPGMGKYKPGAPSGPLGTISPAPDAGTPTGQPPATPAWLTDIRNAALLGDLHFKQGKVQDAIAAYQKALDLLGKALPDTPDKVVSPDYVTVLLTAVDLCNKQASAYVQAGNSEAAANMLSKASDLAKRAERLTGAPATANPQPLALAPPLPGKLVVTASKKLLDDVGAGKLTFEAFCKAATVDYTGSPINAPQAPEDATQGTDGKK